MLIGLHVQTQTHRHATSFTKRLSFRQSRLRTDPLPVFHTNQSLEPRPPPQNTHTHTHTAPHPRSNKVFPYRLTIAPFKSILMSSNLNSNHVFRPTFNVLVRSASSMRATCSSTDLSHVLLVVIQMRLSY